MRIISKSNSPFLFLIIITLMLFSSCKKDLIYFPGTVQEEMDKAIDNGFDGMIVYVNQNGNSSFYAAGLNDRKNNIPADPHLLFKIASISKLYMAAAASKLVANGQLSLDNTLAQLVPEVKDRIEYANKITIKMMLQHRSGIPEYIYEAEAKPLEGNLYLNEASRIFDKPADFKPDRKERYSNTNYLLLGLIMDRVLGYSHHDYIYTEILSPLGLFNTYCLYADVDSNKVMHGYLQDWEPSLRSWDHIMPGGSMVASAEDVGIFLKALIDGTLLTQKEQSIYDEVYKYEHTGWVPGYTSIARYHKDIDAVIIQFINTSGKESLWLKIERTYSRIVRAVEKEE